MNPNLSTHAPDKLSSLQWDGLDSSKFRGGRFHENHPRDELDSLLSGSGSKDLLAQGKKTFVTKMSDSADPHKVQLRTFDAKYQKSTIF